MSLDELQTKALEVKQLYATYNQRQGSRAWEVGDYMAGFVGDVGDLSKLIMAKQGLRHKDRVAENIEHELADCLWSLLVIAHELDVDIEQAYTKTMEEIKKRF